MFTLCHSRVMDDTPSSKGVSTYVHALEPARSISQVELLLFISSVKLIVQEFVILFALPDTICLEGLQVT